MKSKNKVKWIVSIGLAALLLIALGIAGIVFYMHYLSILEIGKEFTKIFWTDIIIRINVSIAVFVVTFLLTFVTNFALRKNTKCYELEGFAGSKFCMIIVTIVVSLFGTSFVSGSVYSNVLMALNATAFQVADPVFFKDIGYYVFSRPLKMGVIDSIIGILTMLLIYSAVIYVIYFIRLGVRHPSDIVAHKGVVVHLSVTILVVFAISAMTYQFRAEDLLFVSHNGSVGGGYTSMKVWLNFYRIAPVLLIGIVCFSIFFLLRGRVKKLIVTIALYPAMWIITVIVAVFVQNVVVMPNEALREQPYIENNMKYTKMAYHIDEITELPNAETEELTAETIMENTDIIDNIRITDYDATLAAYNQLQGIWNYYQFKDVDVLPYREDGKRKLAFISARELQVDGKNSPDMTYVNRKMRFTHGYGVVISPVNEVTAEGQPEFLAKDIPQSVTSTFNITQPRIYYGEADNEDYVIVNTNQKELDYAQGQQEFEHSYTGYGGIQLNPMVKLLYAIKYGDLNMLTSGYITSDSRLLINRSVVERVKTAVPFLDFDEDPQISIDNNGRLKWVIDGYTKTRYYPYSQRTDDFNYVRNSVKAVVDAYDGNIELYVIDQEDPIIQTYSRMYPGIFKFESLPGGLSEQIRYPDWLFQVQADIYKKYHTSDPLTFYSKSDVWDIAREKIGVNSEIKPMQPYNNMVTIDREPEVLLMLPYTLENRDNNLVGWLGVRTDASNYGKLVSYKFPTGKHVYGTLQIENKIDNDPAISKEMTLWNEGGSTVMRGNLIMVPIADQILYVEPLYITSQNQASLPEVKRIILAYGDKIVMENTLDAAIDAMFSTTLNESGNTQEEDHVLSQVIDNEKFLIKKAIEKYNETKGYLQGGDWENYGKAMKELDDIMTSLEQTQTPNQEEEETLPSEKMDKMP